MAGVEGRETAFARVSTYDNRRCRYFPDHEISSATPPERISRVHAFKIASLSRPGQPLGFLRFAG